MIELDKKFIQKVLTKGGVERDVFAKRYESYIWSIINKKFGNDSTLPAFLKNDIFQYVFIKLFDDDGKALQNYINDYSIPFQNYLSLFVSSRVIDFVRKEVKQFGREVVILNAEGENAVYELAQSEEMGASEALEVSEFFQVLKHFEDKLTEKEKSVFRLMSEGASSGEIAEELELEIKQVYKIVFKIKNALRASLIKEAA